MTDDQKHLAEYELLLDQIRDRTDGVAYGDQTGFYLVGRGGTGKTFTVRDAIERINRPSIFRNARMTPMGLFEMLGQFPTVPVGDDHVNIKLFRLQPVAATGKDEHHRVLAGAEDTIEGLLIGEAGLGRVTRVGMEPDPPELHGLETAIHLSVEEVRYRRIAERDAGDRDILADSEEVLHIQEVIRRRDAKAADLGAAPVPEEQELRPGGG